VHFVSKKYEVFLGIVSYYQMSEMADLLVLKGKLGVARDGIEPPTQRFSVSRSTD
jgi:hypothetical protein